MTTSTKRVFGKITTQDEHEDQRQSLTATATTTTTTEEASAVAPTAVTPTPTAPAITPRPLHRKKRARTTLTLRESIRIYDTAIAIDEDVNYFESTSMINGSPKWRGSKRPRRQRRPGVNKQLSPRMSMPRRVNSLSPLLLFPSPLPSSLPSSSPFSMSLETQDQKNNTTTNIDDSSCMEQQQNQGHNLDCSELVTMTESLHVKDFHHNKGGHHCERGAISIHSTR